MAVKKWRVCKVNGWWVATDPEVRSLFGAKVYHQVQFPHWQQAMDYANIGALDLLAKARR